MTGFRQKLRQLLGFRPEQPTQARRKHKNKQGSHLSKTAVPSSVRSLKPVPSNKVNKPVQASGVKTRPITHQTTTIRPEQAVIELSDNLLQDKSHKTAVKADSIMVLQSGPHKTVSEKKLSIIQEAPSLSAPQGNTPHPVPEVRPQVMSKARPDILADSVWPDKTRISKISVSGQCYVEELLGRGARDKPPAEVVTQVYHKAQDPVIKESTTHSFEHRLHRDILHEKHVYEHEHIVQPVREYVTGNSEIHQVTLPALEHVHDHRLCSVEVDESNRQVLSKLSSMTTAAKTPSRDTHSHVEETPAVREVIIRHITREFHPVIERYIKFPHVVNEHQFAKEIHKDHASHRTLIIKDAITADAWRDMLTKL